MRNSNLKDCALIIIVIVTLVSSRTFAQSDATQSERMKNFGWSLKQFEKNGKKDKKQKKNTKNKKEQSSTSTQNSTAVNNNNESNLFDNKTSTDEETIRVETSLVINDVLVVNDKGKAVTDLESDNFIITEDGIVQKTALFSFGENTNLPRSIVLVFDNRFNIDGRNKNALDASMALVDKLVPQDKMAIVTPDIKLILDFTNDKTLLKNTLNKLNEPNGSFSLAAGTLMAVLSEMFDEKDLKPIVISLSGGLELSNLKPDAEFQPRQNHSTDVMIKYFGTKGYGFGDLKQRIAKSRATIYSIIPFARFVGKPRKEQLRLARISIEEWRRRGFPEDDPINISRTVNRYQETEADGFVLGQTALMQVAGLSGGYAEFIEKPEDAQRVFETIFAVINNRYTIGYFSTNQTKDGKLRKVKITVRGHPEYTILHRESYLSR